jgi:hypothetical protein
MSEHFEGKDALTHVVERQTEGLVISSEIHGTEIPGHISAYADALRESAVILMLFWTLLYKLNAPFPTQFYSLCIFGLSIAFWKMGRSAWLGWSRLERLHRVLEQEKWEIEHNREQEIEELKELYSAKGFSGKLLDDVVNVLMADNDRALRVMLQEELGLTLESHDHPLKQGLFAGLGALSALSLALFGFSLHTTLGLLFASFFAVSLGAFIGAKYERNRIIPAICWNLGLAGLSLGTAYFLMDF